MTIVRGRRSGRRIEARRYKQASIVAALVLAVGVNAAVPQLAAADGAKAHSPRLAGAPIPDQPAFKYPLAVDVASDGAVWVADSGHNQVVRVDPHDPAHERRLGSGSGGATLMDFSSPTGIAHNSHGHVFVVDQGNNRVVELNEAGVALRAFGGPDSGAGGLNYPGSIALDEHDNVYVTDIGNFRVVEYGSDGKVVRTIGSQGSGNGEFTFGLFCLRPFCHSNLGTPAGIAAGGGALYVVDNYDKRVEKFTEDGTFVAAWPSSGGGMFDQPAAVALDGQGHVLVVDFQREAIVELTTDGAPLNTWAHQIDAGGHADDSLSYPQGITVSSGHVLVADSGNDRIQEFSLTGAHTAEIGTSSGPEFYHSFAGIATSPSGDIVVSRPDRSSIERYDPQGHRLGAINTSLSPDPLTPGRLSLDRAATVYVQGPTHPFGALGNGVVFQLDGSPIYRFAADGTPLGRWGHYYPGPNTIFAATRAVVAPNGDIYVADAGRYCVERFDPAGDFIAGFGICAPDGPPPPPPPPGCGGSSAPPSCPPPWWPPTPVRSSADPNSRSCGRGGRSRRKRVRPRLQRPSATTTAEPVREQAGLRRPAAATAAATARIPGTEVRPHWRPRGRLRGFRRRSRAVHLPLRPASRTQ